MNDTMHKSFMEEKIKEECDDIFLLKKKQFIYRNCRRVGYIKL